MSLDTRDHILYIKEDTGRFKTFLSTHFIGAALMAPETHACGPRPVMACGHDLCDDCFGRVVATTGKASALEGTVQKLVITTAHAMARFRTASDMASCVRGHVSRTVTLVVSRLSCPGLKPFCFFLSFFCYWFVVSF